jgi:acetate kinase
MSSTATRNRVFVINCGSSSLKYQLVDPVRGTAVASGLVEQIGEPLGRVTHTYAGNVSELIGEIGDHTRALDLVYQMFHESRLDLDDAGVAAVGHRIAHGGTVFERPHVVTDDVLEAISQLSELAPLHNPANVCGIEITKKRFPDIPHVAVFDTEFFADLPPSVTSIPIDAEVTHKYGIRRYGFHGTSHQYASEQAAQFLARDLAELNTIVLHIGSGASAAAVRGGRAADVTTGMTTVGGLIMGMRPGDVDPGVILHLLRNANMGVDELEDLLNRRSGLKGMCGANDFREINRRRHEGDEAAQLAYDVFVQRIRRFVGAYLVTLGRVDVIAFTAGIGQNAPDLRADVLANLEPLGIRVDAKRNNSRKRGRRRISADDSTIEVLVIPANEELAIARAAWKFVPPIRGGNSHG